MGNDECNDDVCDIVFDDDIAERGFIYTITMVEKIEELVKDGRRTGLPDFGDSRIVGFYFNFDDAVNAVLANYGDLYETIYKYAIVEKVEAGVFMPATSEDRLVFKYDDEHETYYQMYEEPKVLNHICGISIG